MRILRHAKAHVTKDRYIKAVDLAVLDAMQTMQAMVDALKQQHQANAQQLNEGQSMKEKAKKGSRMFHTPSN